MTSFLFTGEPRDPALLDKTMHVLRSLRADGILDRIVWVTWDDCTDGVAAYRDQIELVPLKRLTTPPVLGSGPLQQFQLLHGVARFREDEWVIKSRPDVFISDQLLRRLAVERRSLSDSGRALGIFMDRVWTSWFSVAWPFNLDDLAFAGTARDLAVLAQQFASPRHVLTRFSYQHLGQIAFHPHLRRMTDFAAWLQIFLDIEVGRGWGSQTICRRIHRLWPWETYAAIERAVIDDDRFLAGLAMYLAIVDEIFSFDRPSGVPGPLLERRNGWPWRPLPSGLFDTFRHDLTESPPVGTSDTLDQVFRSETTDPHLLRIRSLDPRPHGWRMQAQMGPTDIEDLVRVVRLAATRSIIRNATRFVRVRAGDLRRR